MEILGKLSPRQVGICLEGVLAVSEECLARCAAASEWSRRAIFVWKAVDVEPAFKYPIENIERLARPAPILSVTDHRFRRVEFLAKHLQRGRKDFKMLLESASISARIAVRSN